MRFAIEIELPVEVGNALEKDPKALELIDWFLGQAEAAYFSAGGRRRVIVITKAESYEELSKQIVPIWHTFKTYLQVEPVANIEEFKTAFQETGELVKGL